MTPHPLRIPARLAFGAVLVLAAGHAMAHPGDRWARDDDERRPTARVLEVVPREVDVRVDVPEQRCWREPARDDDEGARRTGGAILGGLLGGVIGHTLGEGDERGLATAAGVVVGGLIGHEVAASQTDARDHRDSASDGDRRGHHDRRDERAGARDASRCQLVSRRQVQRQVEGYDVLYQYQGRRYWTHLPYDPGPTLDLDRVDAPAWR